MSISLAILCWYASGLIVFFGMAWLEGTLNRDMSLREIGAGFLLSFMGPAMAIIAIAFSIDKYGDYQPFKKKDVDSNK